MSSVGNKTFCILAQLVWMNAVVLSSELHVIKEEHSEKLETNSGHSIQEWLQAEKTSRGSKAVD